MIKPPIAEVRPRTSAAYRLLGGSSLWLLTLLCLLVAGGLVWWSLPPRGLQITIRFPEGHGLQAEDPVRFRGIEVGSVETVQLDESLNEVEVEVLLKPSASQLASEGTRFWIVRPELSLTRISGLETAIGHKYIGVSPGLSDASAVRYFQGLADVPVDTLSETGMELTLRGEKGYSVSRGAPLTFRGVEVGTVLDVALSQGARYVDVRVRVFDQYADLLTENTKFWATAGLDLEFEFGFNGGFSLDTESLETLARGGVSMLTTGQGKPASPGDMFTLHATAKDDWFAAAEKFATTSVELKGAVPIKGTWQSSSFFGGKRTSSLQCNALALQQQGVTTLLLPADVLEEVGEKESFTLAIEGQQIPAQGLALVESKLGLVALEAAGLFQLQGKPFVFADDLANAEQPIDCLAVRRAEDPNAFFHVAIKADSIRPDGEDAGRWKLIDFNGDRKVWHGSPVVSAADGKLVGVLLIFSREAVILKLGE